MFDFVTPDGVTLQAYAWEAEGQKADLCVIHGLGEHAGRYEKMAQALNERGIGVYAYDQRGHGRSPGKRAVARLKDLSSDARAFTDRIHKENGLPAFLFGHSMGGGVGLYTLINNCPDIVGAVITSPWLYLKNPPSRALIRAVAALPWLVKSLNISNGLGAGLLSHDTAVTEAYTKDPLNHGMIGLSLAADMMLGGEDTIRSAARLSKPLLLCHGEADGICDVEGSRAFAANAGPLCTFKTFPGQFHELHNEPEVQQELFKMEADFILGLL